LVLPSIRACSSGTAAVCGIEKCMAYNALAKGLHYTYRPAMLSFVVCEN
jgi:hypothetical protein